MKTWLTANANLKVEATMTVPRSSTVKTHVPDHRRSGLGNPFGVGVALALAVVILASGFSWIAIGGSCSDGIERSSPQYAVCEILGASHSHEGVTAGKESNSPLHVAGALLLFLPVLILVLGAIVSFIQDRPKAFRISLILASIGILWAWIALILLDI
jgi:hypothetical protein